MSKIHIVDSSEKFKKVFYSEFAEFLHDTFHYNVYEATSFSEKVANGKKLTLGFPIDSSEDYVINKMKELGLIFEIE